MADGAPPHEGPHAEGGLQRFLWPAALFFILQSFLISPTRRPREPRPPLSPSELVYPPLFRQGQPLKVLVFLRETANWTDEDFHESSPLAWRTDVTFGSLIDTSPSQQLTYTVGDHLLANGSVWLHIFVAKKEAEMRPSHPEFQRAAVVYSAFPLVKYAAKQVQRRKHLLAGSPDDDPDPPLQEGAPWTQYWKPTVSFALVEDFNNYQPDSLPEPLKAHIHFDFDAGGWLPVLFVNEFWTLQEQLIEVNDTLRGQNLPLNVTYDPIGVFKWQLLVQMELQMQQQAALGLSSGSEEVKRLLMDTNPWLLGLTIAVTLLHSIFDFLAFKNDIQFWKGKTDLKGLSLRSITINVGFQAIVFLYLLDNDTSWVILISSGIGLLIELWKVSKAFTTRIRWWGYVPMVSLEDKDSYTNETKEYDDKAMRVLGRILAPLFAAYIVYSLLYQQHKGWYSFVLNTLVGGIYMFGFIMMTPQLFINYKLKSVAHLPWRTFVYKALNTFIDDLFAFIIKMPTLHRLSCFRDDAVFLVYLYQRWIYPVDVERINEFGQRGDGKSPDDVAREAATGTLNAKGDEDVGAEDLGAPAASLLRHRAGHAADGN